MLKKATSLFASTSISKADLEPDLVHLYPLDLEEGTSVGVEGLEAEIDEDNLEIQPIEVDLPPLTQDEYQTLIPIFFIYF